MGGIPLKWVEFHKMHGITQNGGALHPPPPDPGLARARPGRAWDSQQKQVFQGSKSKSGKCTSRLKILMIHSKNDMQFREIQKAVHVHWEPRTKLNAIPISAF